jgi:hypothetical protein
LLYNSISRRREGGERRRNGGRWFWWERGRGMGGGSWGMGMLPVGADGMNAKQRKTKEKRTSFFRSY